MFDKLVESAKEKRGRRARRLFLATVAVYAVALTAIGIATVIGFRPALAGGDEVLSILIPPPVPSGPDPSPVQAKPNPKSAPDQGFVAPIKTTHPPNVDDLNLGPIRPILVSGGDPRVIGRDGVIPGAPISNEPPPPPPPTPTPVVKPAAPPAQDAVVRLTSMLTQGRVVRRVQPPYPVIAKQARIEGPVQVQIDISEDGAVTNVTLLSGHPLLRDAALRAAKQWQFIPTELNGHRVRAIGMITFNFTLH
ncbi:MAG TPA: energy transducer TonB [Blastocatellia bacterium]|nr:energy transducer TonB [Blastocatellia bacterium]